MVKMGMRALLLGASTLAGLAGVDAHAAAPADASSSASGGTEVGEIIVTAQKRAESIQSVPIAVSAFNAEALKAQRLDSAANLELSVPNLNFSQSAYGAANFQIRGIGYSIVTAAGDSGVGVHENNAPLDRSRITDSQFYDVERVEVLRGPQGTLYGRNATGGVVNEITAKPTNQFGGDINVEAGNYDTVKINGAINIPVNNMLDVRLAAIGFRHDGYQSNDYLHTDIDGQNLYSTRLTVAFHPTERIRAYFMWEHFKEDDNYTGDEKTLCAGDPGPASVGGVPVTDAQARAYLSVGCLQSPLTSLASQTGVVNSASTIGGQLVNLLGFGVGNLNAGSSQPNDPHGQSLSADPYQHARNDNYQLNVEWDLTPSLKLSSLTNYNEDHIRQGAGGIPASTPFFSTPLTPGGVANDPQVGRSPYLTTVTYNNLSSRQWSEEVRLQSSFAGPINFNVGGIYFHINRYDDVFIPNNGTTLFVEAAVPKAYVDPNFRPNGSGHNYYESTSPYRLESEAAFGEVYWQATSTLKFTAGLRYTDDKKFDIYVPLAFLSPGQGPLPGQFVQKAEFREVTGRFNADWTPTLPFTDKSLVYASYACGYKGGGFNAPNLSTSQAFTYAPEFVDAFEVGTKNLLLGRSLTLNLTGFYYSYSNYQYSVDTGLSVATANINTTIYGAEFESLWSPIHNLGFNANIGFLHTRIDGGPNDQSIDPFDLTAGNASLIPLKSTSGACVGNVSGVATLVSLINAGAVPAAALIGACPTAAAPNGPFTALGLSTSYGVAKNITGNQLPTSPKLNVSLGAQYKIELSNAWSVTPRADYHYQSSSYGDIYNDPMNRVPGWSNVNTTVTFDNPTLQLQVQLYAKNLLNSAPITAAAVDGTSVGNIRSAFYLDPRTYGVSVSKTLLGRLSRKGAV